MKNARPLELQNCDMETKDSKHQKNIINEKICSFRFVTSLHLTKLLSHFLVLSAPQGFWLFETSKTIWITFLQH